MSNVIKGWLPIPIYPKQIPPTDLKQQKTKQGICTIAMYVHPHESEYVKISFAHQAFDAKFHQWWQHVPSKTIVPDDGNDIETPKDPKCSCVDKKLCPEKFTQGWMRSGNKVL